MRSKPKILFIGDYCRTDYVSMLQDAKDHISFYFLFYVSPKEEKNKEYKAYGQAIYWQDFTSTQHLLNQISPNKVVFLYIESYNHLVLNLACKANSIRTYLLEHGLRADYVLGFDPSISPPHKWNLRKRLHYFYKLFRDFRARTRSRKFLINSIKLFSSEDVKFIHEFIAVRSRHNYLQTFRKIKSPKRLADYYIGFSPKISEAFAQHEAPYFREANFTIGIPYFDKLALLPSAALTTSILLIDQPLAEQGLLQWDRKYKTAFVTELVSVCKLHGYQLYVKPHPKQDLTPWQAIEKHGQCIILNNKSLTQIAASIPIVLGFYSTYLMPFAAFNHTTVITYEKHPAGNFIVSKPLIDAGVAHPVYTLDELEWALENIEQLHQQQLPNKARFTADWMYKFDGKAGERLRDILLSNEL